MTYMDGICTPENDNDLLMITAVLNTLPGDLGSVVYSVGEHIEGPWFKLYGNPVEPTVMQLIDADIEGRCALWVGADPTAKACIFYELRNANRPEEWGGVETGRLGQDVPSYNFTIAAK